MASGDGARVMDCTAPAGPDRRLLMQRGCVIKRPLKVICLTFRGRFILTQPLVEDIFDYLFSLAALPASTPNVMLTDVEVSHELSSSD